MAISENAFQAFDRDIGGIGVQEAAVMQNVDPRPFSVIGPPPAPSYGRPSSTD